MDPHYPYIPPIEPNNLSKKEIVKLNRKCRLYLAQKNDINHGKFLSNEDIKKLMILYDEEIRFIDEYVECPLCHNHIHFTKWDNHYKNHKKKELKNKNAKV